MILLKRKCLQVLLILTGAGVIGAPGAFSETISLPLTIDYPLFKSLIIKTAYRDPDQSAILLYEDNGCKQVVISEPRFRGEDSHIIFETKIYIRAGAYLFGQCRMPLEWEGYLSLRQRPKMNHKWVISLETIESELYDKNHNPAKMAGLVWDLVKTWVYEYLEGITIDCSPPVADLKVFLEPLFPTDLQYQAKKMADNMRPGKVSATTDAVKIEIVTDVEISEESVKGVESETISEEKLSQFIDTWETFDAFLVYVITSLANEPLSDEDRQILLDTLLETRYRFVQELLENSGDKDFVRDQFISSWKQLSPVFRNHLGDDPSKSLLGYLAFFTAADALSVLDRIGPTLGIEISRNGLIRLARMLTDEENLSLHYLLRVNTELREILGLGNPPESRGPVLEEEELEIDLNGSENDQGAENRFSSVLMAFIPTQAHANAGDGRIAPDSVKQWIVSKKNLDTYLKSVKILLDRFSGRALKKSPVNVKYHNLTRLIVHSTAWQESCLRQFKVRKGKVTYLRSYNGTSVGLMQINERVWRGMYELNQLRWNIEYNIIAGCEILELYLRRYALRRMKRMKNAESIDNDTLAGVVYAMYNGGPGQFYKFLKRKKRKKFYLSDRLFLEKYEWVNKDRWENIGICLFGK